MTCIFIPILLIAMMGYMGMLIFFIRGIRKNIPLNATPNDLRERITVVVAFRNEAPNLPMLLDDLAAQTLPAGHFDIILVNDHSSDLWQKTITPRLLPNLTIVNATQTGKKGAIRQGCLMAKGNIIVTTDADCRLQPRWLESILQLIHHNRADILIGPVEMLSNGSWMQNMQALDYRALQLCSAGAANMQHPIMCSGANLAFTAKAYHQLMHHINDTFLSGDDMFLLHAAKRHNMCIAFANSPHAVVFTSAQPTLSSFIQQRIRWASKSKAYTDRDTIIVAIMVLTTNVLMTALMLTTLCVPQIWLLTLGIMTIKAIFEWKLFSAGKLLFDRPGLKQFLCVMAAHPLFTTAIASAGFVLNVTWKERRVQTKTPVR
ncbi:MAG: glycosyltransferase [Marinilabiliaceae bacterium]|nr:glycosyltransferase [Marinilabiliaceae bacterium]